MSHCALPPMPESTSGAIGRETASRSFSISRSGSRRAQVMNSLSLALVMATYSSRISSESVSRSVRRATALRASVGYSMPRSVSVSLGPRPNCGCMSTAPA